MSPTNPNDDGSHKSGSLITLFPAASLLLLQLFIFYLMKCAQYAYDKY